MIHSTAEVYSNNIGDETQIWQFTVVLPEAKIGRFCNINCHVFIENKVLIGDYVTVKPGVYLWDNTVIEDHVFIGPNVTFTNDAFPRSKQYPVHFQSVHIKRGASIGANATILGSVTIGEYAIIGAGSVVTKSVPSFALVYGNPAKIHGWVNEKGIKLQQNGDEWVSADGKRYKVNNNQLEILT